VATSNDLSFSNVLLVAPLSFNLLSVGQLCDLCLQKFLNASTPNGLPPYVKAKGWANLEFTCEYMALAHGK
jgi:hypothetical protein